MAAHRGRGDAHLYESSYCRSVSIPYFWPQFFFGLHLLLVCSSRRRTLSARVKMSSDWVKSFSDIAGYAKNAAQQASTMMAGSELERKLAEATSNEPWGASSAP